MKKPLNGTKTHPLTMHSLAALKRLAYEGPQPRQEFNPGVCDRLLREDLVLVSDLVSPYKSHKGNLVAHLVIRHAGRKALEAAGVELRRATP